MKNRRRRRFAWNGPALRRARIRAGLSLAAVATALAVLPQHVQRWERRGGSAPAGPRLLELAELCRVSPRRLVRVTKKG